MIYYKYLNEKLTNDIKIHLIFIGVTIESYFCGGDHNNIISNMLYKVVT